MTVPTSTPAPLSAWTQSATCAGLAQTLATWNRAASWQPCNAWWAVSSGRSREWSMYLARPARVMPAVGLGLVALMGSLYARRRILGGIARGPMNLGKQVRLGRLFSHPSGRLCSVAADHFVGYAEAMPEGLANLPRCLAEIVAARPDAVTLQKGTALQCWGPHAGKVPLIVQAGCFTADERIIEILATPEESLRMGAEAIAIAIGVRGPNEGKFIRLLCDGVRAAEPLGLPVIAHIYPRVFDSQGGRIVSDPENIAWAVRVGIECGADVIKVGYTGDPASFGEIVSSCPVPVVAAGGPRAETLAEALRMMAGVVASGARGATIGRNVWGHSSIGEAIRAFKAVLQDGASPEAALAGRG